MRLHYMVISFWCCFVFIGKAQSQFINYSECLELENICKVDQKYRTDIEDNQKRYIDTLFLDKSVTYFDRERYMRHMFAIYFENENDLEKTYATFKKTAIKKSVAKQFLESNKILWDSLIKNDSINKIRIVNFIKKNGFPKQENLSNSCNPTIVMNFALACRHFAHLPEMAAFFEEENKKNGIPSLAYNSIFQYQNGERARKRNEEKKQENSRP